MTTIKKDRRTKFEMVIIRNALFEILDEGYPMTVRQVFYQTVSKGVIDKAEGGGFFI